MSNTAKRLRGECDRVALVLQGGGALGSYQAGAYQALNERGYRPDWVAGISIGAINAAIIAGNPPEQRVEKLNTFWNRITRDHFWSRVPADGPARRLFNQVSATEAVVFGVDGFFTPRAPNPWLAMPNVNPDVSYYDTGPLRETLMELTDFELINKGDVRLSVGAVDVETGNFRYFDSKERTIRPEHIMASGALPPGFPPVEVEGAFYWDGGLVSNTPLSIVLNDRPRVNSLVFQVDLFAAGGPLPQTMGEVEARLKDIRYSSRTRLNTDIFRRLHEMRHRLGRLVEKLPADMKDDPDVQAIEALSCTTHMHIAHLIYRPSDNDLASKDYEFSRSTMTRRWMSAYETASTALLSDAWRKRERAHQGVSVYDLGKLAAVQTAASA